MTTNDQPETEFTLEYGDAAFVIRKTALHEAVRLSHQLTLPTPAPEWVTRCPHRFNDERCDCPPPSPAETQATAQLAEQETVDQVIRIAGKFKEWLSVGMSPEMIRTMELHQALYEMTELRPDE